MLEYLEKRRLHDTKTFQQFGEGKRRKKKKEEEKGKDKKKLIKIAIGILHISHKLSSIICCLHIYMHKLFHIHNILPS